MIEHRRVASATCPPHVVRAVLAAEDAGFYSHPGVSPRSIARARGRTVRSAACARADRRSRSSWSRTSTSTRARTLAAQGARGALAVALEVKDDKKQILEAYLNEIYFGTTARCSWSGSAPRPRLVRQGAVALTLSEAALLAGMIHNPGAYDPRTDPVRARRGATSVLRAWRRSAGSPRPGRRRERRADRRRRRRSAAHRGAVVRTRDRGRGVQRYGVDVGRESGLTVHSTLDWIAQQRAERALAQGLTRLDGSIERGLVDRRASARGRAGVARPADGAIRAYVGGAIARAARSIARARRGACSAARSSRWSTRRRSRRATSSRTRCSATRRGRSTWGIARGRRATTTAPITDWCRHSARWRIAERAGGAGRDGTGLDQVSGLARRMGIVSPIDVQPAIALGAVSAAPLELAAVFGAFARGGVAHAPHGIARITDRDGNEVYERVDARQRVVLSKETAYEMTSMLRSVVDQGTGAGARAYVTGPLAGKTGTSDDRRDAWFAGTRRTRRWCWMGYDDNGRPAVGARPARFPRGRDFIARDAPAGRLQGVSTGGVDDASSRWSHDGYLAGPTADARHGRASGLPRPYWECTPRRSGMKRRIRTTTPRRHEACSRTAVR
jgi:membrane peptidoglycan carboxypeptidase